MNVYQLTPVGRNCHGNCNGMALVAAHSFEQAKNEYLLNGLCGEMYYYKEFDFNEKSSSPIEGLEWHGSPCVICDHLYIE